MKKYLKNKDYIPNEFILEKNRIIDQGDKRGILILVILVFILLPKSIMSVSNLLNKKNSNINLDNNSNIVLKNNESLEYIMDIINNDVTGEVTSEEGNIDINGDDTLQHIINDEKININTMEDLGENKYRLKINQK